MSSAAFFDQMKDRVMTVIDGLYIEMTTAKLRQYLNERVQHHHEKQSWYKEQADHLTGKVEEQANVSNNPVQSLRDSQARHQQKYTFFKLLADNVVPDSLYRLSQEDCIRLELYAKYF